MSYLDTALVIWAGCNTPDPADSAESPETCVLSPILRTKSLPAPFDRGYSTAELGAWPIERRERWGWLANGLEDEGVPFPESERRAFNMVKAEMGAKSS
jgi:hypothetical protein